MSLISLLVYYFTSYSYILFSSCLLAFSYLILKSLLYFRSISNCHTIRRYLYSLIVTLLAIVPIHCTFIAFGAAFFTDKTETLLLSFCVSVLTVLPCCLSFRISYRYFISKLILLELYSLEELDLVIQVYSICVCVWLSGFPILLDWDRPWQRWPIPCLAGTWIGFWCSKIISISYHNIDISLKFTRRSYSLLS